jgi:Cu+-exporting ATPase
VRLTYTVADSSSGRPVELATVHEAPMHLIVVSRDLRRFQHVHPAPAAMPGALAVDLTLAEPGEYLLFAEFTPRGSTGGASPTVLLRDRITAAIPAPETGPAGAGGGDATTTTARLEEDRAPKVVGGVRVALTGAGSIRAGQETVLTFRLEDPRTGEPLRDLRPYLGEPAHVVIIDAAGQDFTHTHGEVPHGDAPGAAGGAGTSGPAGSMGASSGGMDMSIGASDRHAVATPGGPYGPEIQFHHRFAAPGPYAVWGQFQTGDGRVLTADFVVRAQEVP